MRTEDDCIRESRQDVTIRTSLLEARLLTGSRKLFESMRTRYLADLDPAAFFQAKLLEMRQRHAKYQDTPYALEPNCKESPGGLRDLQVILWMTKAAGLGDSWKELFERGLLTQREAQELARNERLLKTIRARLHLVAGRRQDVLVFDLQTALAESFGYRQTTNKRASEQLMRRYYWAAKAVTQLNSVLLLNIEALLFPSESQVTRVLNERFVERQGMLEITSDDVYERDPHAILETFLLYQRTPGVKGLSPRTLRGLYNARTVMNAGWRNDPENRRLFLAIMQEPQGITHALRLMNQTSVLGRYLINFRRIVGQMQHDLFHVYTVDQHILMVVRNMRRFAIVEHTHEFPFCSQLMASFDKPWVLWVAALFHDIAKGRGGDHSTLGTVDARRFCKQHGIAREDADLICWLVEHHLTMSHVAQKQDLTDPDVIHAFARVVGSERYLTALYLLTVADIRGTSPKVWNAWKGKLLEDLYHITLRVLGGARVDSHSLWSQRKEDTISELRLKAFDPALGKSLWAQLDVAFFLRHDSHDIAWLTRTCTTRWTTPRRWSRHASPPPAKACRWRSTSRTSPTCSRASAATSSARRSRSRTPRSTPRATATRWTRSRSPTPAWPATAATTATSSRWSSTNCASGCACKAHCPNPRRGGCRASRAASRSSRAWTCARTSAASITCCRCPPTTAPACCTPSPAYWHGIAYPSTRHASTPWANASKTCSWSTAAAWLRQPIADSARTGLARRPRHLRRAGSINI